MIETSRVAAAFVERHHRPPRLFFAPGRVNLIGDHTDYNDGFVLPMALELGTVVAASERDDRLVHADSMTGGDPIRFDLDATGSPRSGTWRDHVEGMTRVLGAGRLRGADLLVWSDVPPGAGLSSSASLEVAVGLALLELSGGVPLRPDGSLEVDAGTRLALAAQEAEHEWVGTRSGIMDQLVSAIGSSGDALLIDCRTLSARRVPLGDAEAALLVVDTGVKHQLAEGAYNQRRAECEAAARLLDVEALRDLGVDDLPSLEGLPYPLGTRARHVVTEDARVLEAADDLERGDLAALGRAMYASHRSLRDDFEVSCEELDYLVDRARETPGTLGARMTGAGFGGSVIVLLRRSAIGEVGRRLQEGYRDRFGVTPALYRARAAAGARVLA